MARVDLQRPIRFLRLSVFSDWASAGGDDFYAVGAGLIFINGISYAWTWPEACDGAGRVAPIPS